ncbi:MAG: glycosyltransferase family 4 protein, partial [Myxococcales bacterium]|nr:glycosyltransferase family 4 protein [Myxococcales bacterium]
ANASAARASAPQTPGRARAMLAEYHYQASAVAAGLAQRADAYHAHDLDTLRPAHACARLTGARLVYDSHELWIEWQETKVGAPDWLLAQWRRTERAGYRAADRVITVGDALAAELEGMYGAPTPAVVRNCAPLMPLAQGGALRALIGGDPARPLVLYQGGFSNGRGLLELVAAADFVPEADVVFMGHAAPYRDEVAAAAARAKHGNVFVQPAVGFEQLWAYTCSADVGVVLTQPVCRSYELSLSNKIFEYLVAGCAVLASDLASHRQLAEQTGAVAVADASDPATLGAALAALVADRGRLAAMGAAGRAAAEAGLNAQAEFAKVADLYAALAR